MTILKRSIQVHLNDENARKVRMAIKLLSSNTRRCPLNQLNRFAEELSESCTCKTGPSSTLSRKMCACLIVVCDRWYCGGIQSQELCANIVIQPYIS